MLHKARGIAGIYLFGNICYIFKQTGLSLGPLRQPSTGKLNLLPNNFPFFILFIILKKFFILQ